MILQGVDFNPIIVIKTTLLLKYYIIIYQII